MPGRQESGQQADADAHGQRAGDIDEQRREGKGRDKKAADKKADCVARHGANCAAGANEQQAPQGYTSLNRLFAMGDNLFAPFSFLPSKVRSQLRNRNTKP